MFDYLYKWLQRLPDDFAGMELTPAAAHLFEIRDDPILLTQDLAKLFHTVTAECLWISGRAWPDIKLPTAFLCTRVKAPDEDDYKKLKRVIRYIRQTIHLPLIIGGKKHNRGWYIDASFAVHQDMKSHTGSFFTLGRGSVYSRSAKQKLNTNISTAAELVARGDTLPQIVWMRNFAKHQGNMTPRKADNVFQDNEAA